MTRTSVFRNYRGLPLVRQDPPDSAGPGLARRFRPLWLAVPGLWLCAGWSAAGASDGPSFDCGRAESGSIEALVCGDAELSALDRKMADVYAAASAKAHNEHPPVLKGEQRGWIKGRNDCWKAEDVRACVEDEYVRRIAELQARYALVDATGPVFYACDGHDANEVVATFYATEPPTLIAERGDRSSFMLRVPSGSGAKYAGGDESFWEHQGEAMVVWGFEAPVMRCKRRDPASGSGETP